ncbi:DUF4825 domain-containing protein [Fictibacillus fluitans]|uniref:DUF4825 domain-containing protein n=1 Tax=Fictibacillus fluitans TaxID=3058422 RepID=A0ABT8HZ48_9BACL|nr:DUF4825 domain-containing protein [Fictibacillus sp. NE201]MDN4526047.1 DUF4825 domain-containing protein [Fictibacillus sp. NE201]
MGKKGIELFIIVVLLILSGCSNGNEPKIKTIDQVNTEVLRKNAGTYVGDSSKDLEIIRNLAGGDTLKTLDLTTQTMKITYGHKKDGALTEEEINEYWFNGKDRAFKNFYFNAMYMTLLIPNAKGFSFQENESHLTISRGKIVSVMSRQFTDFPKGEKSWDKKAVSHFLKTNESEIKEMAVHYKKFF